MLFPLLSIFGFGIHIISQYLKSHSIILVWTVLVFWIVKFNVHSVYIVNCISVNEREKVENKELFKERERKERPRWWQVIVVVEVGCNLQEEVKILISLMYCGMPLCWCNVAFGGCVAVWGRVLVSTKIEGRNSVVAWGGRNHLVRIFCSGGARAVNPHASVIELWFRSTKERNEGAVGDGRVPRTSCRHLFAENVCRCIRLGSESNGCNT